MRQTETASGHLRTLAGSAVTLPRNLSHAGSSPSFLQKEGQCASTESIENLEGLQFLDRSGTTNERIAMIEDQPVCERPVGFPEGL